MKLYVNSNVVCSGVAPANSPVTQFAGGGWGAENDLLPWDMDQCKFFNSNYSYKYLYTKPYNKNFTFYSFFCEYVVYVKNKKQ